MSLSRWFGRFAVGSSNDSFTVDATAKTCTAGNYYMKGYTGEATVQFIEHMEDLIVAVVASSTVTMSSVGIITITFGSGTHTITWTDADLKTLLGFDGVDTSIAAASFTALSEPQYVWSPDTAIANSAVSVARLLQPVSSTTVHCSRDGTLTSVIGNTRYVDVIEYQLVDGTRAIIPGSGSVNKEFEQFFIDVVAAGELIRILPDRDTYAAATDYVTVCVGTPGEPIGSFDAFARKRFASYQGQYDMQIPVMKYVS